MARKPAKGPGGRHDCDDVVMTMAPLQTVADRDFRAPEWRGLNERGWCSFAMGRSRDWLPVIGLDEFDRVDLEYQVAKQRSRGMPRFDAVGWREGIPHLIEAKVKCTPAELMAGVGQLLYYRTVATSMGWPQGRLILISPAWPPLFAETVAGSGLSVDVVKLTPHQFTAIRSAQA